MPWHGCGGIGGSDRGGRGWRVCGVGDFEGVAREERERERERGYWKRDLFLAVEVRRQWLRGVCVVRGPRGWCVRRWARG